MVLKYTSPRDRAADASNFEHYQKHEDGKNEFPEFETLLPDCIRFEEEIDLVRRKDKL